MTPHHIEEIFVRRGYAAARSVAVATYDRDLRALVERIETTRCLKAAGLTTGEIARRDSAFAAACNSAATKVAAEREAYNASLKTLAAHFKSAA